MTNLKRISMTKRRRIYLNRKPLNILVRNKIEMIDSKNICKRCKAEDSIKEITQLGELVCTNCGLVLQERTISEEYESRTCQFDKEQQNIQCVNINKENENNLGTKTIIVEGGKTLIINSNSNLKRIDSNSNSKRIDRNFKKIQKFLSSVTSVNISQKLIEEVKELYYDVNKKMNMNGKKFTQIIIALYYQACINQGIAKTFEEVTNIFKDLCPNLTERKVKKAYNRIKRKIESFVITPEDMASIEKNCIERFIGDNLDKWKHKMLAFKIIDNINTYDLLGGKTSKTIAGLAIYLSYELFNEQLKDFRIFSNEPAIKKAFNEIKDSLDIIIPQNFNNS